VAFCGVLVKVWLGTVAAADGSDAATCTDAGANV